MQNLIDSYNISSEIVKELVLYLELLGMALKLFEYCIAIDNELECKF